MDETTTPKLLIALLDGWLLPENWHQDLKSINNPFDYPVIHPLHYLLRAQMAGFNVMAIASLKSKNKARQIKAVRNAMYRWELFDEVFLVDEDPDSCWRLKYPQNIWEEIAPWFVKTPHCRRYRQQKFPGREKLLIGEVGLIDTIIISWLADLLKEQNSYSGKMIAENHPMTAQKFGNPVREVWFIGAVHMLPPWGECLIERKIKTMTPDKLLFNLEFLLNDTID